MLDIHRVGPAPLSPLAIERFVRMRDGVRLATDVYLPEGDDSPGDTILIRLPYDKSGPYTFIALIAEYFMARGYRVVAQDVRGKFRSVGRGIHGPSCATRDRAARHGHAARRAGEGVAGGHGDCCRMGGHLSLSADVLPLAGRVLLGDELEQPARHAWLAESQFIGMARPEPGLVCIRVFRLR